MTPPRDGRATPRATASYSSGRPATMASAASRAETNASYIPSPESGSTRPAASPTSSARPRAAGAPSSRIGKPVSTDVGQPRRDRRRAHAPGARGDRADVAPPPSSRRRRDSRDRPSETPSRSRRARRRARPRRRSRTSPRSSALHGDVPLERDAANDPVAETDCPRDDAVGTVGADEERRHARAIRRSRADTRVVLELEVGDRDAVPEVGSCRRGLLREMEIEPTALGHRDQGLAARPRRPSSRYPTRMTIRSTTRSTTGCDVAREVAEARARSARHRTACRAESAPCRRAGRALPSARDAAPSPIPQARHRRRERRNAPRHDRRA